MPSITVRNVPDAVHRAIRVRAAQHERSVEAEVRAILEAAARPPERVKLGTLLFEIGREIGLTEEEHAAIFGNLRDKSPARAVSFE